MSFQYPFRVFANANLGPQYDYTHVTGEWLPSAGTGQLPVLPEINLATGNVILKSAFVKTQETTGKFAFGFVYNAQSVNQWSDNIPCIVNPKQQPFIVKESDGSQVVYTFNAKDETYISPPGADSKRIIKQNKDGTFLKTDCKSGEKTLFDAAGKISRVYDARGFSMIYAYLGDNLKSIESDAGVYTIEKTDLQTQIYFVETGKIEKKLLGSWYFSGKQLNSTVIPLLSSDNDYTLNYIYDEETTQLKTITQTDGTAVNLTYTAGNKVNSLQLGSAGPNYNFNYSENKTTITDALQFVTTVTLNSDKTIDTWEQLAGDTATETIALVTVCTYNFGDLEIVKKPDGAQTVRDFNSQGLVTQQINAPDQATEFDYDPETLSCVIKRELISGAVNNNPVWAVTRYVYNVIQINTINFRQLRFTVSPTGCVTEFRYDADMKTLESERTYLKNTFDLSGLKPTDVLNLEDMEEWVDYQPMDKITLKTFLENNRGQKTQLQIFTKIHADGTGLITDDASHHVYDYTPQGNVILHTEKTDLNATTTTTQTFDGLNRLLNNNQNELKELRTITYSDTQKNVVITEPNGRTATQAWNDAGQTLNIITQIKGCEIKRVKCNGYDVAGRMTTIENIDKQVTHQSFDSLNRLRFTITPAGRVTEIRYDDIKNLQTTIQYYNLGSISTPPSVSIDDVTSYQRFDKIHRLQFSVDGRGAVTEYRYDLLNRKIATINYAEKITPVEIDALKAATFSRTPDPSIDMIERVSYDNDNHILLTQDAAGYVISHQRNAAGHEIYRRAYATPVPINLNIDIVRPSADLTDDFDQYYFRDAKGQLLLVVDGIENSQYVKQKKYYPTGKIKTETDYANTTTAKLELDIDPNTLIPTSSDEDQTTNYKFDARQRLTQKQLPEMRLYEVAYDNMGNAILESEGDDPTLVSKPISHTTAKRFDDWGQLIAIAPPLVYEKLKSILNDAQIEAVWNNQSERFEYDTQTGLHTAKFDIVPDDVDATLPQNQAKTSFFSDADRRIVLTVGPEGQAQKITTHPVFDKPSEKRRFAVAISLDESGGFITPEIEALIPDTINDVVDQYKYDGKGDEKEHTDPDGYVTTTDTNMFGDWKQKNIPINSAAPSLTINRQFNLRRQCISKQKITAKKTITTSKEYKNSHGLCSSTTNGNGAKIQFTHEPRGVTKTITDAMNNTTCFTHDAFKRETKRLFLKKQSTQTVYNQKQRSVIVSRFDCTNLPLSQTQAIRDAFNNITLSTDAKNNTTHSQFNAQNQWETKTDSLNNIHERRHDLRGLLRRKSFIKSNSAYATASEFDFTRNRELKTEIQDADSVVKKITQHQTNALAQRVQTITPANHVRKNKFNLRSLVTEHHKMIDDKTAIVTAQDYNAQKQSSSMTSSTTTQSHRYTETKGFDDFGRTVTEIKDPMGLALTRTSVLDDANRLIASIDPKGQTRFLLRDLNGNICFEINPNGGVTEHRYNESNQAIFTTQYITAVDLSKVTIETTVDALNALITMNPYDRQTYYFYDDVFNERFRVNSAGVVTETRYDLNNIKIGLIQYYNPLSTISNLSTETLETQCAQIRNLEKDKATFQILDSEGQVVFIFNPDGSVIQQFYYSTPHVVNAEIKYATLILNPENYAKLSIADIQAKLAPSPHDRQSYWVYDNLNRLQFYVNPLGAVTRYDYLGDTLHKTKITEFKNFI